MEHHIESKKNFRYFTHGDAQKAKYLLYILHGYGQLAFYFLKKFDFLNEDYFIVAPEGMHRFYLNGSSGRVGASWMTKEDRDIDISDNIRWLNKLDQRITDGNSFEKKIILGFSQGGATAARWNYDDKMKADHLIIWASVFPPDLNPHDLIKPNEQKTNYFVLGTEDEYYTEQNQKDTLDFYSKLNFNCLTYKGKHDIDSKTVQDVFFQIDN